MISRAIVVIWSLFCLFGLFYGLSEISRTMDPNSPAVQAGTAIGVVFWIFIWGVVVVPTALIGLLFKRSSGRTGGPQTTPENLVRIRPSRCSVCGTLIPPSGRCPTCGSRANSKAPTAAPASQAQQPPSNLVGQRYTVIKQIGGGAMKKVYLAEDSRLAGRQCA